MIYEYKCPVCDYRVTTNKRGDTTFVLTCDGCGVLGRQFRRVWRVSVMPVMQEHFNNAVGKPVSSMSQMKRELRELSQRREDETGIPHNFVPCDYRDKELLGATNEGIDESNRVREKIGAPLLPEVT